MPSGTADKDRFSEAEKLLGHWLEVAANKGNTLAYWILAENKQVSIQSFICPVDDKRIFKRAEQLGH